MIFRENSNTHPFDLHELKTWCKKKIDINGLRLTEIDLLILRFETRRKIAF